MKTITKFLTLVLSLFCVFGMISPVYAEENEDSPTFKKYSVWDDSNQGNSVEITSNENDAYDYTLTLGDTWYGVSFNWDGDLKSSGQSRLDKFSETGFFDTSTTSSNSALTNDGKSGILGWEYYCIKPIKVGTTTVEVFEGKPITFHIVDGSETATDEEAVQKTAESIEWMKKNIFNCLDNKASKEYVNEIITSEIKYDYTNVGPDYGTTIEIVDFNLVKATQTESGSISFTVKISKGDSSASIDYSNTLAPVPTPEIKSLTVHSQNPFGEVLAASDGYHLDAGTSYTICLTYIGDVEVNMEKTFVATKAFDSCSSQAGSDGYPSVYEGIDDFAGITPTTNGTYELELVPGTKTKFIVTGGKDPDKLVPEISENSPTTTVSSDVDVIVENTKASYSTEQQEVLTEGGSADVKVSVSKTIPSDEDKKLVEAQLNSTNKIAMYLELGVRVSVKNKDGNKVGEDVIVSETGTPVKFTVALDDSFINTNNKVDRTYQVVRIHNGVVDVLPATFDADSKTITFETDKFSTYALMYTDTTKASKTPATADGMNVALYSGVAVVSVLAIGFLFFFKKRNA